MVGPETLNLVILVRIQARQQSSFAKASEWPCYNMYYVYILYSSKSKNFYSRTSLVDTPVHLGGLKSILSLILRSMLQSERDREAEVQANLETIITAWLEN